MDSNQYYCRLRGKIRGPFAIDQLRRLASRGQFSRLHQISTNKVDWRPATDLQEVFSSDKGKSNTDVTTGDSVFGQSFAPVEQWYYAVADQKLGPVSKDDLLQMISMGQLTNSTLVWRDGLPDWLPAEMVFAPASPMSTLDRKSLSSVLLTVAVSLACVGLLSFGTIYWLRSGPSSNQSSSTVFPQFNETSVTATGQICSVDISNEEVGKTLNEAVGMVIIWLEIDERNGVHREMALSHGSCFVVNPEGYAITNEHVVKDFKEWSNSTERVEKLANYLLKGYEKIVQADPNFKTFIINCCSEVARITPRCTVHFGKKGFTADVRHISRKFDMAILKIQDRPPSPWFALSATNALPKTSRVRALGFPDSAGEAQSDQEIEQRHAISQTRPLKERLLGTDNYLDSFLPSAFDVYPTTGEIEQIQEETSGVFNARHNAHISHGNSGGPLVLLEKMPGVVYGINTRFARGVVNVPVAFSIYQMREEIEDDAKVPNLVWR